MAIHTIDLNYLDIPQAIAAYLVTGPDGPVLIETGPASTLHNLEEGVRSLGYELRDIRHALVTHIHLDHAGAAGHLARNETKIYVHDFGARHLIDPSKLIESATRIYGNQMNRLWGTLLPVPADQIVPVHDGDVLNVCGMEFTAIETAGHARHHHAFALDHICFAGDIAGICVPNVPEPPKGQFLTIPTPPPEFDHESWKASIDRIESMRFDALYLTHFGVRQHVQAHLDLLRRLLDEHVKFVVEQLQDGRERRALLEEYVRWNREQARAAGLNDEQFAKYVSQNLLSMNLDGMLRYWNKQQEQRQQATGDR